VSIPTLVAYLVSTYGNKHSPSELNTILTIMLGTFGVGMEVGKVIAGKIYQDRLRRLPM
jgi:hypothetical protein